MVHLDNPVWNRLFPPKEGDLVHVENDFLPVYQDAEILEIYGDIFLIQYRELRTGKYLKFEARLKEEDEEENVFLAK